MRLWDVETDIYRDHLRVQEDQGTQRAREHILLIIHIKNSMGWWVREGLSLAGYRMGSGGKRELRDASSGRQPRSTADKL